MTFRADLHCHSSCSDGTDAPEALLHKAKAAHLSALSITDHDTLYAYTPSLFQLADELAIELIVGIEVSSEYDDATIHVLGYGVNLESSFFAAFLEKMQRRRKERNRDILRKLAACHMVITEQELEEFGQRSNKKKTIGRPHIAALMTEKKYVQAPQEAFDKYLKEGARCYSAGFKYTPLDVIEAIHKGGGVAILAHPHFLAPARLKEKILELPFDGIECYYGVLSTGQITPWVKLAEQKGWLITGGSDYHGTIRPHITLGASWIDEAHFKRLLQAIKK
ncbi:MAG: protein tRPH [Chlamydiota bacterium]|jgi:predicted metal-dependent phosphoesterase TrpH